MASPNIFDAAPVTATVKVAKSKADKREVYNIPALDRLSATRAMIATLETLSEQFEGEVKEASMDILVGLALKTGKKPETFNLVADKSTGQFQLRKRSSASALTDDELALAKALGIPTVENTKVEERYVFNPDVLADQVVMAKISKALTRIPELAGMCIVQHQEAIKTTIIADGALEVACGLKSQDKIVTALGIAAVQAVKTSFDSENFKDALDVLAKVGIKLVPEAKAKKKAKV